MDAGALAGLVVHTGTLEIKPVSRRRHKNQKQILILLSFGVKVSNYQQKNSMQEAVSELYHHLLYIFPERKSEDLRILSNWIINQFFYSVPEQDLVDALFFMSEIEVEQIRKCSPMWAVKVCLLRHVQASGFMLKSTEERPSWDYYLRLASIMLEQGSLPPENFFFQVVKNLKPNHLRKLRNS